MISVHVHYLDPHRSLDSPVHALDARVKFILTVAFILTVSLTPYAAWPVFILLLAAVLSVEILSRLGLGYVQRRASLALPFVLAALPLAFSVEGTNLFTMRLGAWTQTASLEGLERFLSVGFKSWLSIQAAIVLTSSTSFPDLLRAMRAVRLPRLLVAMFGLMWRYLFVLADEALRLMRARAARSGRPGSRADSRPMPSFAWRARVAGGMAGSLFLRAFNRSDRIYGAMLSRCYDGEVRSLPLSSLSPSGWLTLAGGFSLLILLLSLGVLFWG